MTGTSKESTAGAACPAPGERVVTPLDRPADTPMPIEGKREERTPPTRARAPRYWASAMAMVWFETATISSRSSSPGSPSKVHHFPRPAASFGWAAFQVSPRAACFSANSL